MDPPRRPRLLDAVGQLRLLALVPRQRDAGEQLEELSCRRRGGAGGLGELRPPGPRDARLRVGAFGRVFGRPDVRARQHRYGDGAAVRDGGGGGGGGELQAADGAAERKHVHVLLRLRTAGVRRDFTFGAAKRSGPARVVDVACSGAPQTGEGSGEARTLLRARVDASHVVPELPVRRPLKLVHAGDGGCSLDTRAAAPSQSLGNPTTDPKSQNAPADLFLSDSYVNRLDSWNLHQNSLVEVLRGGRGGDARGISLLATVCVCTARNRFLT